MGKVKDLTGQVFGRLQVVEKLQSTGSKETKWKCLCICGKDTSATTHRLTSGHTKSCGCLLIDRITSHKLSRTRQYSIWDGMRQRCDNPGATHYERYGGRGITYDPSWKVFESFWADMSDGYADNLTLDRIDNNKDYCKENCRWVTKSIQGMNRGKKPGCKNEYIGVDEMESGTFCARRKVNGKKQHLGVYKTALEAATVYDNHIEQSTGNRPNNTPKETSV